MDMKVLNSPFPARARVLPVIGLLLAFFLLSAWGGPRPALCEVQPPPLPSAPAGEEDEDARFILPVPEPWKGDFDGMKERRLIRIVVPHSKTFFFLDGPVIRGTAYEIGKAFQAWLNKRYRKQRLHFSVVFVPTTRDRILPALMAGEADIAIGNLTVTTERSKLVDFSHPLGTDVKEVVVTGPSAPSLESIEDLGGREILVRRSSSYQEHLVSLNRKLKKKIRLKPAEEDLEDEDLLEMVNAGLLPIAVVDEHKAQLWARVLDRVVVRTDLAVNTGGRVAWAVRKHSPLLVSEINRFVQDHALKTGLVYDLYLRYLRSTKYVKNATSKKEMKKYRAVVELFKKYGEKFEFEHLMLMAQGYQESRLDQSARSPKGAVGIMQLLPSTAEAYPISIPDVDKSAENNIHAGTKYLRWIADNQLNAPSIDAKNRALMSFAAYNAGPGNLARFRRVAAKSGLDPDIWFGNVEQAAARIVGRETVQYVGNIYKYYIAYKLIEDRRKAREAARP
jgi:membrane-bound lytic murein transglycosylase MltF